MRQKIECLSRPVPILNKCVKQEEKEESDGSPIYIEIKSYGLKTLRDGQTEIEKENKSVYI